MNSYFEIDSRGQTCVLKLIGSWRLRNLEQIASEIANLASIEKNRASVDSANLIEIDTAGAMLLFRLLKTLGIRPEDATVGNIRDEHRQIIELVSERFGEPVGIKHHKAESLLFVLGRSTCAMYGIVERILAFVGHMTVEMFSSLAHPKLLRLKEFSVQFEQAAVNAVPIVALVTFLIGVVLAYLFGIQMEQYGANIFIVDAVSISVCREISPILVAIIAAGRSGSAYTAHIGTMKMNEEIDAMITMGLSPMRVLVLPRVFALMLAMPILVFLGDAVGIAGGLFISDLSLGISGRTFLYRLPSVLPVQSFVIGLAKAPVFAFFIAAIGCHMGLGVENNARSVGLNTTATVVRSIVSVILLNAAFAVIFSEIGI